MSKIAQDDAYKLLNSIVYSTQFDKDLKTSVDRVFERLVLPELLSGKKSASWFDALFRWCIENSGWRQELAPSDFDEAGIQTFLVQLSLRLDAYRERL